MNIPATFGEWRVENAGKIFGTLQTLWNFHFDESGYATVSPKAVSLYSSANDADFGLLVKVLYYNAKYFIVTDQECFELDGDLAFTNLATTETGEPHPNASSDAVVWQDRVYVSSDSTTDVRYWGGTSWADPSIALSSDNVPHPLAVMGNFSNGHLIVGENNTIKRYDTSHSLVVTCTINNNYQVTGLLYRQNVLYIITRAIDGGEAKLFTWNGSGTSPQGEYGCGSDWIFSIEDYDSSVYIVTNAGELLRFNGGGFDQKAVFPVYNSEYRWSTDLVNIPGKVAMNGMKSDGDKLYININGNVANVYTLGATTTNSSFYLPSQPSGVWCFDPAVGLYPRNLPTTDGYTTFTASSLSSNTLTLSASTNAQTGEPILCTENGSLTGITEDKTYYIIRVSATEIKMALTRADAINGNPITIGGAVTSATFLIINYNQNGQPYSFSGESGAIGIVSGENSSTPIIPDIFKSIYLWGFGDQNNVTRLVAQSRGSGVGTMTVSRIFSQRIKDTWNKLYTKFSGFFLATDKIVVRANHKDRVSLPTMVMQGTYSNNLTIGTADSLLDLAEEGDSVVLISGNGAGNVRTIAEINEDEVTFTESVPGVTAADTVVFYIEPFKKYQDTTTDSETVDDGYIKSTIDKSSQWIDIQLEVRGNIQIPQIQLVNSPHTNVE